MIVRKNLKWSIILKDTWKEITFYTAVAVVAFVGYHYINTDWFSLPNLPVGMLSTALAIFLGFRNNQVYDRWWEARQLWGGLVNYSRAFARQVLTFPGTAPKASDDARRMLYRHLAFIHALKMHLRVQPQTELAPFLEERELAYSIEKDNVPNAILLTQGKALRAFKEKTGLPDMLFVQMDQSLVQFHNIQGGCERIKNTPLPRQYNYFTKLFVHLHGLLLPFAFVADMGLLTIPVSVAIAFVFMSLSKISNRLENPFENSINDIPMSALCRTIEINIRENLGESALPKKLLPVDGFLY